MVVEIYNKTEIPRFSPSVVNSRNRKIFTFSNTLIIQQVKTKKISTAKEVRIPGRN